MFCFISVLFLFAQSEEVYNETGQKYEKECFTFWRVEGHGKCIPSFGFEELCLTCLIL